MKTYKILVCGGRNYNDEKVLFSILDFYNPEIVIHGFARGTDTLASIWAYKNHKAQRAYPARWDKFGKGAGPIRNYEMITKEKYELDFVIAFPGGRGTENMIQLSKKHLGNEKVIIINSEAEGMNENT